MLKKIVVIVAMVVITFSMTTFAASKPTYDQTLRAAWEKKQTSTMITDTTNKSRVVSYFQQNAVTYRLKIWTVTAVGTKQLKATWTYKGNENKGTPDVVINSEKELHVFLTEHQLDRPRIQE